MNTRRLRLVRPRWTLGTMLLIVGWSAVVVWLNVRPRFTVAMSDGEIVSDVVYYGYPFPCAYSLMPNDWWDADQLHVDYYTLALNVVIGVLVGAVGILPTKYLLRAIVAGLRAVLGKPPPSNSEGPERAG